MGILDAKVAFYKVLVPEKGIDLFFSHIFWMDFGAVEFDETQNPFAIGLLGTIGVMMISQDLAHLIHQL
jgi:hypothetical protein